MKVGEKVDGMVILVDVENKEALHTIHVSDDVSCVVWLQEKQAPEQHQSMANSSNNQVSLTYS